MSGSARARERVPVSDIRVRFLTEGLDATGQLAEVSRAGLFVRSDELPRPGAVIALQFRIPEGELVDLRGEVRWNTQGLVDLNGVAGFGVLLREPPQIYREFYLWIQDRLEKEEASEPGDL